MRTLLVLLSLSLLCGCASGPVSPAKNLYMDHGGFKYDLKDYEAGFWEISDTVDIPVDNNWDRRGRWMERSFEYGHVVFGHFPQRENEPSYENGSWKAEARVFLASQVEKTLKDLNFEVLYKRQDNSFKTGFISGGGVQVYSVFNDELGCREEDRCTVTIQYTAAHLAQDVRIAGYSYGGAQNNDRVMDPTQNNFIRFNQAIQAPFDQRIFYKKLSENMPVGMYIYLNAKPEAYVQINDTEVVAYPYLLNQGQVMLFEEPISQ